MHTIHCVCSPAWHRCRCSCTAERGPEPQPRAKHLAPNREEQGQLDPKRSPATRTATRAWCPATKPAARHDRQSVHRPHAGRSPLPRGPRHPRTRAAPSCTQARARITPLARSHASPIHLRFHSSHHSEASTPRRSERLRPDPRGAREARASSGRARSRRGGGGRRGGGSFGRGGGAEA